MTRSGLEGYDTPRSSPERQISEPTAAGVIFVLILAAAALIFVAYSVWLGPAKVPRPSEHVTPYCPNLMHTHWEPCGPVWETDI